MIKDHLRSRKWTAALLGTSCVLFVYCTGMVAIAECPGEKAQMVVSLANIAVVFMGAITGSLITGQSFVDWRHGSQSQFAAMDETQRVESNRDLVPRTFAPKHYDDETIR